MYLNVFNETSKHIISGICSRVVRAVQHLPAAMMLTVLGISIAVSGCGKDDACNTSGNSLSCPNPSHGSDTIYAFESRFAVDNTGAKQSSVSYSGQVVRHLLITDMMLYLDQLTERIDRGDFTPVAGQVAEDLNFYLNFDLDTVPNFMTALLLDEPLLQARYADLSSSKNLLGKLAGNDPTGQHRDWIANGLVGLEPPTSPEALIARWVERIDALAVSRMSTPAQGPTGKDIEHVYISPEGLDYRSLLRRFLLGSVAYSQAADDYLGHDVDGKGLLSDNSIADEDKAYTPLEHAWDEAFGYFGMPRDGGTRSTDANNDGKIDLMSEHLVGDARLASGLGDSEHAGIKAYPAIIFNAFVNGRQIIADSATTVNAPALSGNRLNDLLGQCEIILNTWDEALRHSVVSAIDEVIASMNVLGTNKYRFEDHAAHWSHMYATLLSLQFNPLGAMSKNAIAEAMDLLGGAPVLSLSGVETYRAKLASSRNMVMGDLPLAQ